MSARWRPVAFLIAAVLAFALGFGLGRMFGPTLEPTSPHEHSAERDQAAPFVAKVEVPS